MKKNKWLKITGFSLLGVCLALWCIAFYWSLEPDNLDVRKLTEKESESLNVPIVTGSYTTATLIAVIETMLEKPGGFISNDIMVPGVLMDNMPNWEYGVLIQSRDMLRAMRDYMSRSQSQSKEDPNLREAESRLNIDHTAWAMPDAQDQYRESVSNLRTYMARLGEPSARDAQFYARADNLSFWLSLVESRLGNLSQRLTASVGRKQLNTALSLDPDAKQSTPTHVEDYVKTPWVKVDDVFYESRGSTWALIQLMKAIQIDFKDVLAKKNAHVSFAQIIRELEATQQTVMAPWVMNGTGFGLLANYSLVMASYISRANAAVIDLRDLLQRG
ncbi:MAG: DUF2333 family protein [Cellvibrionales bacterium]|nr:DUF2333 family protein [Cellvibrionales bacterium]